MHFQWYATNLYRIVLVVVGRIVQASCAATTRAPEAPWGGFWAVVSFTFSEGSRPRCRMFWWIKLCNLVIEVHQRRRRHRYQWNRRLRFRSLIVRNDFLARIVCTSRGLRVPSRVSMMDCPSNLFSQDNRRWYWLFFSTSNKCKIIGIVGKLELISFFPRPWALKQSSWRCTRPFSFVPEWHTLDYFHDFSRNIKST